jgi:hypothetical protein
MSKIIELTDEQYAAIEQASEAQEQTPASLIARWIENLQGCDRERGNYETEDWFRHLGATEEQIAGARRIAQSRRRTVVANT